MSNGNILLIGLAGSGKSTLANCLLNKSGTFENISQPFKTSDGASGCTISYEIYKSKDNKLNILDTVGFGDPQFDPKFVLDNLRAGLDKLNNKINCVLFVDKKDRFTEQKMKFFELIQNEVFQGKCIKNSIMVVTNCKSGWLQKQNNQYLLRAMQSCCNLGFEFSLNTDDAIDLEEINENQNAIDSIISYIDKYKFQEVNVEHIQTKDFEVKWFNIITNKLSEYFPHISVAVGASALAVFGILKAL